MKIPSKKGLSIFFASIMLVTISGCDLFDLDTNTDPNNPSTANVGLLLTNVINRASRTFSDGLNQQASDIMFVTTSQGELNMDNRSWNASWNTLYSDPLKDLDEIVKATAKAREAGTPNPHYEGIAKVLKAYYFSLMVDLWGDVPYTEAFNGNASTQNKQPAYESASEIYPKLITLCDEAIAHFKENQPVAVTGDVIYGGSAARWKKAAYSLKLRLIVNSRNTNPGAKAAVESLVTAAAGDGGFITDAADDFQFQFSKTLNPDNRHPWYVAAYGGANNTFTYFSHQFMFEMLRDDDPRRPYYLKRQTTRVLDPADATDKQTIPCSQIAASSTSRACTYGYMVKNANIIKQLYTDKGRAFTPNDEAFLAGFFGRDRSDYSGIPLDGPLRTAPGVYPVGGYYDDANPASRLVRNNGAFGNGIFPMITTWMVRFYLAEAALGLQANVGVPKTLFETGLRSQLAKVASFSASLDPNAVAMNASQVETYVGLWLDRFDKAASPNAQLGVVLKQAWFCNLGNGFESYNAFRRTGFPNDLMLPLSNRDQFALRIPYAQDELTLNPNAPTGVAFNRDPIFWDKIGYQFPF